MQSTERTFGDTLHVKLKYEVADGDVSMIGLFTTSCNGFKSTVAVELGHEFMTQLYKQTVCDRSKITDETCITHNATNSLITCSHHNGFSCVEIPIKYVSEFTNWFADVVMTMHDHNAK